MKSNGQLDFSNPEAVQQLTKSLLERDFGLKLELPNDRLCPPVDAPMIIWGALTEQLSRYQIGTSTHTGIDGVRKLMIHKFQLHPLDSRLAQHN